MELQIGADGLNIGQHSVTATAVGPSGTAQLGASTTVYVAATPAISSVSVTPSSGAGFSQTFSFVYSEPSALSDLWAVNMRFAADVIDPYIRAV
jgi:hypothetical protein